jgi:hypothetical protein
LDVDVDVDADVHVHVHNRKTENWFFSPKSRSSDAFESRTSTLASRIRESARTWRAHVRTRTSAHRTPT